MVEMGITTAPKSQSATSKTIDPAFHPVPVPAVLHFDSSVRVPELRDELLQLANSPLRAELPPLLPADLGLPLPENVLLLPANTVEILEHG